MFLIVKSLWKSTLCSYSAFVIYKTFTEIPNCSKAISNCSNDFLLPSAPNAIKISTFVSSMQVLPENDSSVILSTPCLLLINKAENLDVPCSHKYASTSGFLEVTSLKNLCVNSKTSLLSRSLNDFVLFSTVVLMLSPKFLIF